MPLKKFFAMLFGTWKLVLRLQARDFSEKAHRSVGRSFKDHKILVGIGTMTFPIVKLPLNIHI